MNHLIPEDKTLEFTEIINSNTDEVAKFAEEEQLFYMLLIKYDKLPAVHKSHLDKSLEEIESFDKNLKRIILGFKALDAVVYKRKHIYSVLNAIKHYFFYLKLDKYILLLKETGSITKRIDNLYELFECLCKYNIEIQKSILNELNAEDLNSVLLYYIQQKLFVDFYNTIKNNKLEVEKVLNLCSLHESYADIMNVANDNEEMFALIREKIDKLKAGTTLYDESIAKYKWMVYDIKEEDGCDITKYREFLTGDDVRDLTIDEEEKEITNLFVYKLNIYSRYFTKTDSEIEKYLLFIIATCKKYINNNFFKIIINKLTNSESEYYNLRVKQLIEKHESNNHINFEINNPETNNPSFSSSENMEFTLPSDLFETNQHLTYHNKNEFFNLKPDLKIRKYPELLERLINELADWGYIENNLETKRLFAYRFTGKVCLRPEKFNKIHWKEQGRSKRGVNLLYILINMTVKSQRYNRAKEFFTGIEWGEYPNQDANPKNASCELKKLLHKISPDDFPDPNEKLEDSSLSQSPHRK